MPEEIRFEIPEWVEKDKFESYFRENIDDIWEALDHSAYEHDDRSQVDEISVVSIDMCINSITIYYDVEISAYHGCRDANYANTDERYITARREGRVFFFDKFVYPERRSTYDEF